MIRGKYNEFANDLCDSFHIIIRDKTIFTNFLRRQFVLFGRFKLQMFMKLVAQQNYSTLSEWNFCLEVVFAMD